MKNISFLVCIVILGLLARPVSAADRAADIAALKKGFATYFSLMDQMQADVHKVRDAKATSKLLDDWTRANELLIATTAKYKQQFPDAVASKTPPPELAEEIQKVADSKFTYGSLTSDLSVLIKTFRDDPAVKAATERQRKSVKQLQDSEAASKTRAQ